MICAEPIYEVHSQYSGNSLNYITDENNSEPIAQSHRLPARGTYWIHLSEGSATLPNVDRLPLGKETMR
jgi:hypothetical protein